MHEVTDFEYDTTSSAASKGQQTHTFTQQHRTYDRALATHNGYLGKIAVLKGSFTNRTA